MKVKYDAQVMNQSDVAILTLLAAGDCPFSHTKEEMAHSKESLKHSENSCEIKKPPDLPRIDHYINRTQEAVDYELTYWQFFRSYEKREKRCIGSDTSSDKASRRSYAYLHESWSELLDDVLTVRKVTVTTVGSSTCWRIYTRYRDSSWMENKSAELVVLALYNLFLKRTEELGVIKNCVQECDIYGDISYVIDIEPFKRCRLCKPIAPDSQMGCLFPASVSPARSRQPRKEEKLHDSRPQSSAKAKAPPQVLSASPAWNLTESPKQVQPVKPIPKKPNVPIGAEEVRKTKDDKHFFKLETVFPDPPAKASLNWCRGTRRNYHLRGFYATYIPIPDAKREAATYVAEQVYHVDFETWRRG